MIYVHAGQVILLVKKIVIDACVAIDLNIPKVDFLEDFLKLMGDDNVLISTVNLNEVRVHDWRAEKLLRDYGVHIIDNNETEFGRFSDELKILNLALSQNDRHVIFLANKSNADFIVSSDFNVYDKASRFKKIKKLSYMNPMTTVTLLAYIYKQDKIGYSLFLEKTLNLYKYKEIDNMLNHLSEEDLNVTRQSQMEIIDEFKQSMKERFHDYKTPLIMEYKYLLTLGRLPT